jgi:hypothetical protein
MFDFDSIVASGSAIAVLACVAWGTVRVVSRLRRATPAGRSRALVWGMIPIFSGAFLGYVDGSSEDAFIGLAITFGVAGLVSCIAVALWLAEGARTVLGSALFECVAALAWAYAGASLVISMLRRLA